jgi:hypothetical protein
LFDTRFISSLVPMTGVPFFIFSFYMVTDPATTPSSTRGQIVFGASVGAMYGVLMAFHQAFGLITALLVVCISRGVMLYLFERGFMPELRAFLDGKPSAAARPPRLATAGVVTTVADVAPSAATTPAIPTPSG